FDTCNDSSRIDSSERSNASFRGSKRRFRSQAIALRGHASAWRGHVVHADAGDSITGAGSEWRSSNEPQGGSPETRGVENQPRGRADLRLDTTGDVSDGLLRGRRRVPR